MKNTIGLCLCVMLFAGCASIDFDAEDSDKKDKKQGLSYFTLKPYLFVSRDENCVVTASVISIPNESKSIKFKSGFGSSAHSVTLENGMITSVGQTTNNQVPNTITSIAGLVSAFKQQSEQEESSEDCLFAGLYEIADGEPSETPITLKIP